MVPGRDGYVAAAPSHAATRTVDAVEEPMTQITVTPLEPRWYGVEVEEGHVRTGHRVVVPEDLFESGLPDAPPEDLVRESIAFLVEHEPAVAIPPELRLVDIADDFRDYPEEIRRRVGA
jgi:hypothetical protein